MVDLTMTDKNDYPTLVVTDDHGNKYLRVYMTHRNGKYQIYPGNYIKREFTDETLPDPIKVTLGLINAYEWPVTTTTDSDLIWKFGDDYPSNMFYVGWRDKEHYCLVLSDEVVRDLRGQVSDSVRGTNNDSRSESQSEGKESS